MEPQKTPSSQSDLEKEQNRRYHNPRFQDKLQICGNQNSMILAQKQIHISMEQYIKPRNKLMIYSQLIFD